MVIIFHADSQIPSMLYIHTVQRFLVLKTIMKKAIQIGFVVRMSKANLVASKLIIYTTLSHCFQEPQHSNELKQIERHWEYVQVDTHLPVMPTLTILLEDYGKAIKMMIFGRTFRAAVNPFSLQLDRQCGLNDTGLRQTTFKSNKLKMRVCQHHLLKNKHVK